MSKYEIIAEANSIRVSFLKLRMLIIQGRTIGTNWELRKTKAKFQIMCLFKNSETLLLTWKILQSIIKIESKKYEKISNSMKINEDPKFPRRYST